MTVHCDWLSARAEFLRFVQKCGPSWRAMEDRRKHPRSEVEEPAYVYGDGSSTRCTILNLSAEGAAIEVPEASNLPRTFRLMTAADRVVRNCTIAWIMGNKVGVQFDGAVEAPSPKMTTGVDPTAVSIVTHSQRQFMEYLRSGEWVRASSMPERPRIVARLIENGWIERDGLGNNTAYRITAAGLDVKTRPVKIFRKSR